MTPFASGWSRAAFASSISRRRASRRWSHLLEDDDPAALVERIAQWTPRRRVPLAAVRLHAPVERQEIWAAGVTYLRSKTARMEESDFSATAYDRVYDGRSPGDFLQGAG